MYVRTYVRVRTAFVCGTRSRPSGGPRPLLGSRRERALSRPGPGARTRSGGRTGTRRRTARVPVTVCRHNLGGRPARRPVEPPISRGAPREARARRSGRVSGVRPSDRRGPGPVGHRGRNVRSTGRCSYNLRITRRRADSCGLHRSTSQVIRRSGSGVRVKRKKIFCASFLRATAPPAGGDGARRGRRRGSIFRSTLGRGSRRAGVPPPEATRRARPRGRIGRARGPCGRLARASAGPAGPSLMILPQVHLRKPCYDFYFL